MFGSSSFGVTPFAVVYIIPLPNLLLVDSGRVVAIEGSSTNDRQATITSAGDRIL